MAPIAHPSVLLVVLSLGLRWVPGRAAPALGAPLSGAPALPLLQALWSHAPPGGGGGGGGGGPGWRRRPAGEQQQPLRYMLALHRSVADRYGRPRRNRRLATNTVRLVRPFAKTLQPVAGSWLVWNLDYRLEGLPQTEQLVRATVVYSRTLSLPWGQFVCTAELSSGAGGRPKATLGLAPPPGGKRNATTFLATDTWVEMEVSGYPQLWVWTRQQSPLLHLRHTCSAHVGQPVGATLNPGWEGTVSLNEPFLLLYLNDTWRGFGAKLGNLGLADDVALVERSLGKPGRTRQARQAGKLDLNLPSTSHPSSTMKNECALHPFRVTFRQLGWDHWIIAPHSYRPQYCKGRCPRVLRFGYHSPNHAIIQNLVNELVDQSVPPPSCVPYEYSPISVLMMEPNGNILHKLYENMMAKSCTCR